MRYALLLGGLDCRSVSGSRCRSASGLCHDGAAGLRRQGRVPRHRSRLSGPRAAVRRTCTCLDGTTEQVRKAIAYMHTGGKMGEKQSDDLMTEVAIATQIHRPRSAPHRHDDLVPRPEGAARGLHQDQGICRPRVRNPALSMAAPCAPAAPWRLPSTRRNHRQSAERRVRGDLPPSPIGWPSTDNVCAIGPALIVLDTTTMPILRQRAVPGGGGPRASKPPGGVARDRRGPPEPFLEEMVGQVLQPGLNAPIVLAGDEQEAVGAADLVRPGFPAPPVPAPWDVPCTSGRASAGRPPWHRSVRHHRRARENPRRRNARGGCPCDRSDRSRRDTRMRWVMMGTMLASVVTVSPPCG